jgi:hypothetical protein
MTSGLRRSLGAGDAVVVGLLSARIATQPRPRASRRCISSRAALRSPRSARGSPRIDVPHRVELAVGAVIVVLVLTADLRGATGFSSFGVLVYYGLANASTLSAAPCSR